MVYNKIKKKLGPFSLPSFFFGVLFSGTIIGTTMLSIWPDNSRERRSPLKVVSDQLEIRAVNAAEIYPEFVCLCCGQPLDKNKICCGMAKGMIDYIDSLVAQKLSKEEIIKKTAEKFGVGSVISEKRAEVEALLNKESKSVAPGEKLNFAEAVGQQAPDFTLENLQGEKIKLSNLRGKNVVLFFNEGKMCYPACWNQIEELGKDSRFNSEQVVALSITPDQKEDWVQIAEKLPALKQANILFDSSRLVSSAYDVLSLKSSMHKGTYPGHTYILIDKQGIIRFTYDDPTMAIQNDLIYSKIK